MAHKPAPGILTFAEALEDASGYAKRHALLGNGFSIACRPDRFTYGALFEEATFDGASADIHALFELLGTTDFERVVELLRVAAGLCDAYATTDPDISARLRRDAGIVCDALARVLAAKHPDNHYDITEDEYIAARTFLSHFERIYSVNYDMLLYWTVMQEVGPDVVRNDGFGNPEDEDAEYVAWQPYATFPSQRVFYLHGSLHLYDSGVELAKITWSRTQVPLVTQIRDALAQGRYPLIVTEGTSTEKVTKILHSAYLNHAIRSFSRITGALFVYGLSLTPNDQHLLQRITESPLEALYVSIYGDPSSAANQEIVRRAAAISDNRGAGHPLTVHFYDAESAEVWG